MNKQYIEFKKQREFGDIFTDTFAFIRLELKDFLKTIFQIAGPYFIVALFGLSLYFYGFGSIMNEVSTTGNTIPYSLIISIVAVIILIVFGIGAYVLAHACTVYYIDSYIKNKGEYKFEEIKENVKNNFWGFVGLGILKGLIIGVGFMFCFIPAIYLMVPMFVVFCILGFENKSATESIEYSFKLIKNEWWNTFAIIFILGIIISVCGMVFSLPAVIYQYVKMGIFSGEFNVNTMNEVFDPIYIILNVLSYAFQYILNLIYIVASAFIYFHLNEKRNFTGTYDKIDKIGSTIN